VLDIAGDVWEWVADWHSDHTASPASSPAGRATGAYKVHRGASWYDGLDPDDSNYLIGFRCVASAAGQ